MSASAAKTVSLDFFSVSNRSPLFFIAGPCAMESPEILARVGKELKSIFAKAGINWALKCSFDKANRTSLKSYRGPGMAKALAAFARVKKDLDVPFLTDVHETRQVADVAKVCEIVQIPAFLCRQTDLLLECGKRARVVNIKKGQFLSPWDIRHGIAKVESTGNRNILVTERGTTFGYSNLVVDMRGLEIMKSFGYPVVFDATHSVQLPGAGAGGDSTGGERKFAIPLARAAAAVGIAGIFMETHPDPDRALSDGPNSIRLADVAGMVRLVSSIDALVKSSLNGANA